ncbi:MULTISPECIES: mercury(II) reductase [Bacillaceae]|uniref:Mercuric reductase n=4 Tax=Bacillaceae TaxID=186817 RepID=A0ABX4HN49_9BACI|nr:MULTISPECIES: mercury(II) reductase [Salimicrobium]PBB04602.1 mercury(II) reductase [Salimicrobium humidisoli]SDY32238.1 mercuric reductase [Salimicrobium album]SIS57199.1 mercuric reductase [Salimicrobium salexigens]
MTVNQYKLPVQGMTCTGCEEHVTEALEQAGAKNVSANFRRGEAIFQLSEDWIDQAKQNIEETGYHPDEEEIQTTGSFVAFDRDGDYDLLIVGSGGAAFSAAIKASENGAKVAMVERGTVGGTCVNIGCVPSKTMLRAGDINGLAQNHPFNGLQTGAGGVNLAKLTEQKDELVSQMRQEKYINLIDEYGFDLIRGEASFVDEKTIQVNGEHITAKSFLIATGANPAVPDIPGLKDVDYLTSTTALELKEVPKRLAVIGSGYIAAELGQMFHNFGTDVTLMQRSERLFKTYEPEVSDAIDEALREQGINLITGVTYQKVEQNGDTKSVTIEVNGEKQVIEADQILVATGRKPNTESLNLEAASVKTGKKGEVLTNEFLQTTNDRIYAAGDVTLGSQFVYVAAYEGGIVADNALGVTKRKIDLRFVPGVTFTNPSIATVGLTEQQAKAKGYDVKTSVLPLDAVPRALVNQETTGVYKLIVDGQTRKLIGAHIVSENAGDVIYTATLAVQFGLTIDDLTNSFAPYLTMAEGLKLAALTFDKDVSKLSCCAG